MVNIEEFTARLEKVLQHYNLSASGFADKIGVQRSSISHILSGRNKPSLDFVMKILQNFPEVELYWLLNGKGEFPDTSPSTPVINTRLNEKSDLFSESEQIIRPESAPVNKTEEIIPLNSSNEISRIIIFYKNGKFEEFKNS